MPMAGINSSIFVAMAMPMAETASAPPYFTNVVLKIVCTNPLQTWIKNGAMPTMQTMPMILKFGFRYRQRRRYGHFLEKKKDPAQQNDKTCPTTVAAAPPAMPQPNLKMNTQSKTVLVIAPMNMVIIAIFGNPHARMKLFIVTHAVKKIVPASEICEYVLAYGMISSVAPYSRSSGSKNA